MAYETLEKLETQKQAVQAEDRSARVPPAAWLVLGLIVLSVAGLRLRLLEVPLERDEGEYAYVGQLILQGEAPYERSYTMKFPGTHYAYALILAVFGQTDAGIHWGLLVINSASVLLLFLLASRLFDPVAGLAAAVAFGLLSLSWATLGFTANTEHFVVLPMLGGTLLLLRGADERRLGSLLGAGVLFGLAVLMKQHAAAFVAFGAVFLAVRAGRAWRQTFLRVLLFGAGVALPIGLVFVYLWARGVFEPFWFWTVTYARHYATMESVPTGMVVFIGQSARIALYSVSVSVFALLGVITIVRDKQKRDRARFLLLFAGFSFLALCPGLLFRSHYFLMFVPAASLFAGAGAVYFGRLCFPSLSRNRATAIVVVVAAVITVLEQWMYLFMEAPQVVARTVYGLNPFPESKELAFYLRDHSEPDDQVAVVGSEPQMFFYAGRRSATGFLYTYPLMEPHPYAVQMQQDMIDQIERESPRFLVEVNVASSWLARPESAHLIDEWRDRYVPAHYQCVGVADIISETQTEYRWGAEAAEYTPRSEFFLRLFERTKPH